MILEKSVKAKAIRDMRPILVARGELGSYDVMQSIKKICYKYIREITIHTPKKVLLALQQKVTVDYDQIA